MRISQKARRFLIFGFVVILIAVGTLLAKQFWSKEDDALIDWRQGDETFDFKTFDEIRKLHPATVGGHLAYTLPPSQQELWRSGKLKLPDRVEYGAGIKGDFDQDGVLDRAIAIELGENGFREYGEKYYVLVVSDRKGLVGVTWLRPSEYGATSREDLLKLAEMAVWAHGLDPD